MILPSWHTGSTSTTQNSARHDYSMTPCTPCKPKTSPESMSKKAIPNRLISFQQKQGEGRKEGIKQKRFLGNLWTLEALEIWGHWEIQTQTLEALRICGQWEI